MAKQSKGGIAKPGKPVPRSGSPDKVVAKVGGGKVRDQGKGK